MDIETAREYCLSKKAVTECFPFDEYSLVMKVMNKMFALIDLESANKICLKCDPEYALELREHYVAIEGAYQTVEATDRPLRGRSIEEVHQKNAYRI